VYGDKIAGPVPSFPPQMEERITRYLQDDAAAPVLAAALSGAATGAPREHASLAESEWLLHNATALGPIAATSSLSMVLNPIRDH